MEYRDISTIPHRKIRNWRVIMGLCVLLVAVVVLAISLGLTLNHINFKSTFKTAFIAKCEKFTEKSKSSRNDCQKIWSVFEKAYVGQNPCSVSTEAYDSLVLTVTQEPSCNRKLFWSKTKDMVHAFTEKMNCFLTLEDTLLGFIMDGQIWCGKEGSNETFTEGCPGWKQCLNNTVSSFWKKASAAFAEQACGQATAILNGSITQPFNPTSIFASIEVKSFNSTRMSGLTVVLVTNENNMTNCENPSLKHLQEELDPKLKYSCVEVQEAKIQDCISHTDLPCGACW